MKKLCLIVSLIFLSIGLLGCQQSDKAKELNKEIPQNIPEEMPNDFNFSIHFGVRKSNEINTFDGTVTKDLIADGTVTTELTLTKDEMKDIYKKMQDINIAESKEFTPKSLSGSVCMQEPYEEDEWKITINGKMITHFISGKYCEPTNDSKQLIELRNDVFNIIKSKDEYKSLPKSTGGYE